MRRAAIYPLILLAVLHVVVLFAGFFAPYAPHRQNRDFPFAPPMRLRFIDNSGIFHFRPFVYATHPKPSGSYEEDRERTIPIQFLVSGDPYRIGGVWPLRLHLFGVQEPGNVFVMGTDDYGRDQFSRFLWGAQISMLAGPTAALLALSIGALLGAFSGFCGRLADEMLMALAELFLSLPWFYLLLGIRAILPLNLEPRQAFLVLVCLLGVIGWARPARLVRGIVLSIKDREFVLAARGFGASGLYILRRHVLPETKGVLLTQAALLVPQYILAEVTMSFLGLGVNEPAASWGLMLAALQQYHALVSYWWMWIPAILLVPVFFLYYALAAAIGGLDQPQMQFELEKGKAQYHK
jgi:peptide/nickel transport system permease protein